MPEHNNHNDTLSKGNNLEIPAVALGMVQMG
jgi:hypothetical protein